VFGKRYEVVEDLIGRIRTIDGHLLVQQDSKCGPFFEWMIQKNGKARPVRIKGRWI
jgi:hypothetical protein